MVLYVQRKHLLLLLLLLPSSACISPVQSQRLPPPPDLCSTSSILDDWRATLGAATTTTTAGGSGGSSSSSGSDTAAAAALWDFLTQQYQQDVLAVLAEAPEQHRSGLLAAVLSPVDAPQQGQQGGLQLLPDPLPALAGLDALLLDAIDAAEAAAADA